MKQAKDELTTQTKNIDGSDSNNMKVRIDVERNDEKFEALQKKLL